MGPRADDRDPLCRARPVVERGQRAVRGRRLLQDRTRRWGWWNDNSPWSDGIDPDSIEVAFREAHATGPQAVLLLNDWDVEFINPKLDAKYNLVARLKQIEVDKGVHDSIAR